MLAVRGSFGKTYHHRIIDIHLYLVVDGWLQLFVVDFLPVYALEPWVLANRLAVFLYSEAFVGVFV